MKRLMNEAERAFVRDVANKRDGLESFLMTPDEKKMAVRLSKAGIVIKGRTVADARCSLFYFSRYDAKLDASPEHYAQLEDMFGVDCWMTPSPGDD